MSGIQRFFMTILPKAWASEMQAESRCWIIKCTGCGRSRSIWEAGGIRWKAASKGKTMAVRCQECGGIKKATVEYVPDTPLDGPLV